MQAENNTETFTTNEAAKALNRKPQTLRRWACTGEGPIRPVRIYGRLAWFVDDINSLKARGAK